ncbi:MAG: response regulator, partial [Cyanobacteria bacterium J06649_11]
MEGRQKKVSILIADDDEDDCMLAHEALIESHLQYELHIVKDGEELMDYLYRRGKYVNVENAPPPG